jgi:hypothetical protein
MRKITKESIEAFLNAKKFKKSNTEVRVLPNVTLLILFDNEIAYKYNDPQKTLMITDAGWQTNTTKERLNGIPNVSIYQSKGDWYLNGQKWDGKMTEIK